MSTTNDIPVAQRVTNDAAKSRSQSNLLARSLRSIPWWGYSMAVGAFFLPLAGASVFFAAPDLGKLAIGSQDVTTTDTTNLRSPQVSNPGNLTAPDTDTYVELPVNGAPTTTKIKHFAYEEASPDTLRAVGIAADGYEIQLRTAAADSFLQMSDAARASGIDLVALSGFRTQELQQQLFFDIGQQRNQTPSDRATVSAPPGYSEHHTGYAVDIGDAAVPSTHISPKFEQTEAFAWLQQNAARYGFEMSFPPHNAQGVSYEPWHWRYVGDAHSLETFYKKQSPSAVTANP